MRLHIAHGRAPSAHWRRRTGSILWAARFGASRPRRLHAWPHDDHLECMKRAHRAYQTRRRSAACSALCILGRDQFAVRGRASHAAGWFGRAQRLAESGPRDNVEHGYLLVPTLLQCAGERDWKGVADVAKKAERIAERHGDADLFALAAHERGHALVRLGRVEEGLRLMDEVMVSVTAGELSPVVTGLVYCSVIAYCQDVFQLSRAQAWTQALTGWCEQQPEMVAHMGQCLIHRAEVLQLRGDWALGAAGSAAGNDTIRAVEEQFRLRVTRCTGRARSTACRVTSIRPKARIGRPPDSVTSRSQGSRCCDLSRAKRPLRSAQFAGRLRRQRLRSVARGCFQHAWRSSSASGRPEQAREACDELEDSSEGPQK